MNLYLDIPSPATKIAGENASIFGVQNHGLKNLHRVYWNLPTSALYEESVFRSEGHIAHSGPFVVDTGKHTARSAADKFITQEQTTEQKIWWGEYNRPFSPENFSSLLARLQGYLQGRDIFVQDCYAGSDLEVSMPIRIITEKAWHSLFARTMFTKLRTADAMKRHVPEFTIICAPGFNASPIVDTTRTETFIVANFSERLAIIGGTGYAGEIKKTIFTVLNFLLPLDGILPMHCSANVGDSGDVAIFFGLSGTGKTTLSADPSRHLIGDDEHGWSDNGVFNFEDGCYAKVIRLSEDAEPQIYACTRRFGTVLENVVFDPVSRRLDLDDDHLTENTRAAYPLEFIDNYWPAKRAGHPNNVIFLTCDAQGVMPPISRLTPDQAIYHFISGYTSKIAGTEVGLGIEPEITFSTCFGGPFMVHHPYTYAEMLKTKILKHGANCWLVNTGWTGGSFGLGKRISIRHTRALLNAALNGKLLNVPYRQDPVFGFEVPTECEGVPSRVLDPANTWGNREEYFRRYDALAARFIENFKLMKAGCPPHIVKSGPQRIHDFAAAAKLSE
jgi:phosphoenolpyruvate carboxykinase (ATP)